MAYVYILRSLRDKKYYIGSTDDIEKRVNEHNNKLGAKSVKGKLPVKLVYFEERDDQKEAARRESEIKGWSHLKKKVLVDNTT